MSRRREIPADFAENARLPVSVLTIRYQMSSRTISEWRRELGICVPKGAPRGNRNGVGNQSQAKTTHGIDGIEAVRTCLSCTRERCSGKCNKVH